LQRRGFVASPLEIRHELVAGDPALVVDRPEVVVRGLELGPFSGEPFDLLFRRSVGELAAHLVGLAVDPVEVGQQFDSGGLGGVALADEILDLLFGGAAVELALQHGGPAECLIEIGLQRRGLAARLVEIGLELVAGLSEVVALGGEPFELLLGGAVVEPTA
jgi:hypothetical protein